MSDSALRKHKDQMDETFQRLPLPSIRKVIQEVHSASLTRRRSFQFSFFVLLLMLLWFREGDAYASLQRMGVSPKRCFGLPKAKPTAST